MEKPSIDNIRDTIRELTSIEYKIAGSSNERRVSEYVTEQLRNYGFDTIEEMKFSVRGWNPISCSIKLLEPEERVIEAALFPYSQSLKTKGTLSRINQVDEYGTQKDVGTIGLSSWGSRLYLSPTRTYYKALARGLEAVLISSPDEGDLRKVVVIESGRQLKIPIISISKEDGDYLLGLLEKGKVELEIYIIVDAPSDAESMNLETIIEGHEFNDEEIYIGTHVDSWFSGAADSCAPIAVFLELARLLQEHVQNGGSLKRNVRFLFFGAENGGSEGFYYWCNGSKAYLERNKKQLKKIVAFLSLDSIGFPKPAQKFIGTTADLLQFAQGIEAKNKSIQGIEYYDPPGYGSDHWFFELAGISTIYGVTFPSHLYQTQKDNFENLDYDTVQTYAEFMRDALVELANADLLPVDIFTILTKFEAILSNYGKMKDCPFDLSPLLLRIRDIRANKSKINKSMKSIAVGQDRKLIQKTNRFLSSVSQLSNKTIGWLWRITAPDDIDYLSRLELIQDYIAMNAAIMLLRSTPIGSLSPENVKRLEGQSDCAYNWISLHKPLASLEKERSRIYKLIESEIENLTRFLGVVEKGIRDLQIDER